jgi:hypothetical protein
MEARRRAVKPLALALLLVSGAAQPHDSWLAPSRDPSATETRLEFATGNRYPVQDLSPGSASLVRADCALAGGDRVALQAAERSPKWLDLRAATGEARACWAETRDFEQELKPELIPVYLDEIRALRELRETWARMEARGLAWRETYRKYARIELAASGPRAPAALAMEIVPLGEAPIETGRTLEFQVLRDGKPLAGLPVELVSERSRIGIWRQTDGEGKLRHVLPFAGRWLLRATDLRVAAQDADRWESRFVTLAIEAAR